MGPVRHEVVRVDWWAVLGIQSLDLWVDSLELGGAVGVFLNSAVLFVVLGNEPDEGEVDIVHDGGGRDGGNDSSDESTHN